MPISTLNYFAAFLSDWSLEDEAIPALLSTISRKEGPKEWLIGWTQTGDGQAVLLIGAGFQALSIQGQKAYTYLALNQLLLGQLESDFAWTTQEAHQFGYLWQAYLYLPADLQAYWTKWSILKQLNKGCFSREDLLAITQKEALVERFSDLIAFAKKLRRYWSFHSEVDPTQQIERTQLLKKLQAQSETLPALWQIFLTENLASSQPLPWQRLLRNHLKRHFQSVLQTTTKRPSKRYRTTPGLRVVSRAKIGVVLDTSGSVSSQTLTLFQKEIKKMADLGHQVQIVEADARIQQQYAYRGTLPTKLQGGGGTNYDPAIQYLESKARVDLILYFTDGLGPKPLLWKKVPLIWLMYTTAMQQEHLKRQHEDWPGECLYIR